MIGLGSDHGGFSLKEAIAAYLSEKKTPFLDYGTHDLASCDYPDIAEMVCAGVNSNEVTRAILVCGTGIGICISANKIAGIRAALCSDTYSAKMSRMHNDANVLVLGGRVIGEGLAMEIVDAYLGAEFEGGRHQNRVDKINRLEKK